MKKLVKFTLARTTHSDVELEIDVPQEFLDDEGAVFDNADLRDWINDNEALEELDPVFEEIVDAEVFEVLNAY